MSYFFVVFDIYTAIGMAMAMDMAMARWPRVMFAIVGLCTAAASVPVILFMPGLLYYYYYSLQWRFHG